MNATFERHLPVEGTYNIRDLGGYAAVGGETRWRQILRADALHRLDEAGVAKLVDAGVRTVIDLRHDHELTKAPNPFARIGEVNYVNISLFEQLTPPGAVDEQGRVTNVLLELYKMALAQRQEAIRQVFHCTAGKDRTGIIAALLLAAHGVDAPTIREDYAVTASLIAPMVDELIHDAEARGADVEAFRHLLASTPETMSAFLIHLDETYGGADSYLELAGLSAGQRARLRDRFIAAAEPAAA